MLHFSPRFFDPATPRRVPGVARWNGAAWENLPEGPGDALRGITSQFLPVNDRATPALLFGGSWNDHTGQSFLLRWGRPAAPYR